MLAALALLLSALAAVLLMAVIFRRDRQLPNLAMATLLIALAFGVWWTAIRDPLAVP